MSSANLLQFVGCLGPRQFHSPVTVLRGDSVCPTLAKKLRPMNELLEIKRSRNTFSL